MAKRGFSRFPFADAGGELTGYLHLKDVLYADEAERHEQPVPLKRVRRLATVQAGDEVEDVLATMQRTGSHLARVVDAEGPSSGSCSSRTSWRSSSARSPTPASARRRRQRR